MLDTFEILSTSGVVLWSKTYSKISPNIVNSLIRDVFIEEQGKETGQQSYRREGKTLRWTVSKDLGVIFVAVYQSLLHLQWIDKLLTNVRAIFTELYAQRLRKGHTNFRAEAKFEDYFERQVQELSQFQGAVEDDPSSTSGGLTPPSTSSGNEKEDEDDALEAPPMPGISAYKAQKPLEDSISSLASSTNLTPTMTPSSSRPSTPSSHLLTSKGGPRGSRRARKAAGRSPAPASSGDETSQTRRGKKTAPKKGKRVWDASGAALDTDDEDQVLDYSVTTAADDDVTDSKASAGVETVDESSWGKRTQKGEFVLKDLDNEIDNILASANAKQPAAESTSSGLVGSATGAISSLFSNIVGGKTLQKADLEKPLRGMEDHLLKKNVAREGAVKLCESVEEALVGTKTSSFTSVDVTIRDAVSKALTKILTPTSSLDLLREIQTVTTGSNARPYVLSIVGVNGVGKSTNLSKLAYFLLQNKYRVLICAADTFRSGAVEQLKRHVDNLKQLTEREGGQVDIFEKGYGKDAGVIAADAVRYAASNDFNIVLIDTAGRRHNDTRLMSSLSPFAQKARPDKILMVAEALAGTDSVAQARNFNAAFHPRRVDGFIISKCDTVGSMVGTLVSMVSATGIPVVFLGTGQHYGDLRGLSVSWAVGLLME